MKKGFNILHGVTLFFSLASLGWLVFDFIAFHILRGKMQQGEALLQADHTLGYFIWIGLLVFIVMHILSFITIANQFQYFKKGTTLRIMALVLGIASCIFILSDIGSLSDIGKEYAEGLEVEREWQGLYFSSILHSLFYLIMLAAIAEGLILRRKNISGEIVLKDEVIFTIVHCIGMVCGAIGLLGSWGAAFAYHSMTTLKAVFPFFFVLSLIPYVFMAGYWLVMKLKEKPKEWYDEKQFRDISRAGLLSTLLTIPLLAILYIFNYSFMSGPVSVLWFPVYLYFTILIFSTGSFIFSRLD